MPYLKLTRPAYASLTGYLPGKKNNRIKFTNGISGDIPLTVIDRIAAQFAGCRLVNVGGVDQGPAGAQYRKTTIHTTVPHPLV